MKRSKTLGCGLSSAILAAFAAAALAGGVAGAPDTFPAPLPDRSIEREHHIKLFLTAWEAGMKITDVDGSGVVDGSDVDAFYAALRADLNWDSSLDAGDIAPMFDAWVLGIQEGDQNADGGVDGADVEAFFVALDYFSLPTAKELAEALLTPEISKEDTDIEGPDGPGD